MADLIDRSPPGLIDALCKRIEAVLAPSFWDESESGEDHTPHVHAQYLPVTKTQDEERDKSKDYPIVRVICTSGVISDFAETSNGSEITIHIYFGAYSKDTDNQGWRKPVFMLLRVLQDLLSNTICSGYQLNAPVKWSPLGKDEPPYYSALLETVWQGSPPSVEVPINGDEIITTNKIEEASG